MPPISRKRAKAMARKQFLGSIYVCNEHLYHVPASKQWVTNHKPSHKHHGEVAITRTLSVSSCRLGTGKSMRLMKGTPPGQ